LSIFTADAGMPLIVSEVLTVLVLRSVNVVVPLGIVTGPNLCPSARSNLGPFVRMPGLIAPPVKVNPVESWILNSSEPAPSKVLPVKVMPVGRPLVPVKLSASLSL
jgi:hypothetical protein